MLQAHQMAPDFEFFNEKRETVWLHDYRGQKVVLYFYPKDNTPGCTRQACAFAAAYSRFQQQGILVIGISKDSVRSHQNFAAKYELPFLLVSDPQLSIIQAYDVWQKKKLYGKESMGVVRTTYLIDEEGKIEKVFEKVKPETNAQEILDYLNS